MFSSTRVLLRDVVEGLEVKLRLRGSCEVEDEDEEREGAGVRRAS